MMSANLCAAPCKWQATGEEPCGKPSTHLAYSGSPQHMEHARYWRPTCAEHLRMTAGCIGTVYAGYVDVLAATPIGAPIAPAAPRHLFRPVYSGEYIIGRDEDEPSCNVCGEQQEHPNHIGHEDET